VRRVAIIFIYLKMCCNNGPADVNGPIDTVLHSNDAPTPSVATTRPL
jgi:hypothetical protein